MPRFRATLSALALALVVCSQARAEDDFQRQVVPFLKTYCAGCHNPTTFEAELDLTRFQSAAALGEHFRQWERVLTFLRSEEMPPQKAKQPSKAERAEVLATLQKLLAAEARKSAGDPGVVLPRRLTNAEYNHTVRDLTGVDIRPADSFPVDPASGEGFSNTGEALVMSPSLFKKYFAAAQQVADHLVLTPSGLRFAAYPVVTFADKIKYHEQAILQFYQQHEVAYEDYLSAAWSYRYRSADRQDVTIEQWAAAKKLSPKYLRTLWETLNRAADDPFDLGSIRRQWHALPASADARQISALAENIRKISKLLGAKETAAIVSNAGNGPVQHIDRRKKSAAERNTLDPGFITARRRFEVKVRKLQDQPSIKIHLRATALADGDEPAYIVLKDLTFTTGNPPGRDWLSPRQWKELNPGMHPLGHAIDADSFVLTTGQPLEISVPRKDLANAGSQDIRFFVDATLDREHSKSGVVRFSLSDRPITSDDPTGLLVNPDSPLAAQLKQSSDAFCQTFPNRFVYVDDTRGLSAGFHLIEGVFRDDVPLTKLVLSEEENRELNRLWEELYFGTGMMEKMLRGFVFFERSERNFLKHRDFDPFKEEDPELVKDETLERFEQVYLNRSGVKPDDPKLAEHPIHLFFGEIRQGLKQREKQLAEAKPVYLRQLLELAEHAWRRPLSGDEVARIERFYEQASEQPEVGVEQAVRGVMTSILASPHFCCRIDVPPEGDAVMPLADVALASRLSYFLWSSMPDAELLALAKAGKLNDEATLRQQLARMLQDPKVSALALEFFGQWLRYRDFPDQESVDRRVFPAFNDELKLAMFEEPTRLATYLIQNNRPVTELLYGDVTLVNKPLAAHYGWPFRAGEGEWQKVEGIQQHGRGGVLGMAVFLTANSQPQRTSPVKRGFWVVHKILGEHIPPPPANVAVLPAKETETDGKTIRELLALHTEAETCARCHKRFDPVGLAMEGFDRIGKSRSKDLAGRPVDNVVRLPSGGESRGVPEFLQHLKAERNDDFLRTLCHKFLGYALGRSVELSDQELLEKMQANLRQDGYRFATLFETVVLSEQFRNQRCRDFSLARYQSQLKEKHKEKP